MSIDGATFSEFSYKHVGGGAIYRHFTGAHIYTTKERKSSSTQLCISRFFGQIVIVAFRLYLNEQEEEHHKQILVLRKNVIEQDEQ